jgi:hypothetical protein
VQAVFSLHRIQQQTVGSLQQHRYTLLVSEDYAAPTTKTRPFENHDSTRQTSVPI